MIGMPLVWWVFISLMWIGAVMAAAYLADKGDY